MERRVKRDLKLEEERRAREEAYTKQLQEIKYEMDHQRRINKYHAEEQHRQQTIQQHKDDLANLRDAEKKIQQQNKQRSMLAAEAALNATRAAQRKQKNDSATKPEGARAEWEFLKSSEGASSEPMESLMKMIGLEEVKEQFLSVKSKVDTALRQGVSLSKERFSCSMLGNPGTGRYPFCRPKMSMVISADTFAQAKPRWLDSMPNS